MSGFAKTLLSISLMLLMALPGRTQNGSNFAKATLSDPYAFCEDCGNGVVVGDNAGYLAVSAEAGNMKMVGGRDLNAYYLKTLSPEGKLLRSSEADMKEQFKGSTDYDQKVLKVGAKTYFFYSYINVKERVHFIYCRELSVEKGGFAGPRKLCARTDYSFAKKGSFRFTDAASSPHWEIRVSPDSSKVLVAIDEWDKEKDFEEAPNSNVRVFDAELKLLWNLRIFKETLKRKARFGVIRGYSSSRELVFWKNFAVDNSGNVYGVGRFTDAEDNKEELPDYEYRFAKWSKEVREPVQVSFRLGDKFADAFQMVMDKEENLTFVASYTSGGRANASEGYAKTAGGLAVVQMKETGGSFKTQYTSLLPFPAAAIASFEKERIQRKVANAEDRGKVVELGNLEFKDIRVGTNGSVDVFMEQFRYEQVGNGKYVTIVKVPDDGYAMQITPEGTLGWMNKIPKAADLETVGLGKLARGLIGFTTFGYSAFLSRGNVYVLYTDNPENVNLPVGEKPRRYKEGKKGNLIALKMTPDGKVYKQVLLSLDDEVRISISSAFQYSETKVVLHAQSSAKAALVCDIELN